jgi:arsenite-transporting ATPase
MSDMEEFLEPSLQNIIDNKALKNVFVSGKGGVGKSSSSSSLAVALTKYRKNVLIVSLDPAHNLSDAFDQQFGPTPTKVDGFDNLFAMEVDKNIGETNFTSQLLGQDSSTSGLNDLLSNLPGIDEAMGLFQLMKQIDDNNYDITIFDCAPTGHTLNLLSFPSTISKLFEKFGTIKDKFGPMLSTVTSLLGDNSSTTNSENQLTILEKMDDIQAKVQIIEQRFQDPNYTTFICVTIPEFLSLFETERLVQELTTLNIDVQNIIVNQVLFPDECSECRKCKARMKIQSKYLDQMELLYADFHLIKMPLLDQEIRGTEALKIFGEMLITGKPNPLALSLQDE